MGSEVRGLGPIASEPGKGSFPLPFLPDRQAGALTEETRPGREGKGADATRPESLRLPPRPRPSESPIQPIILLRTACPPPITAPRATWSRLPCRTQPSPHPGLPGVPGLPSLAASVPSGWPLPLSPNLANGPSPSLGPRRMGIPHSFQGPFPDQPPAGPEGLFSPADLRLGAQSCPRPCTSRDIAAPVVPSLPRTPRPSFPYSLPPVSCAAQLRAASSAWPQDPTLYPPTPRRLSALRVVFPPAAGSGEHQREPLPPGARRGRGGRGGMVAQRLAPCSARFPPASWALVRAGSPPCATLT